MSRAMEIQAAIEEVRTETGAAKRAAKAAAAAPPSEAAPEAPEAPETEAPAQTEDDDAPPAPPATDGEEGETGVETAPKEEEKTEKPPSKSWEALYRKEKQLNKQATEMKARDRESQREREEARRILEDFNSDKIAFVEKRGLDFDDWAKRKLAGTSNAPPKETDSITRAEFDAFKLTKDKEVAAAQNEAQARAWISERDSVLKDSKYALIKAWGAEDEVVELAAKALNTHKRLLTPAEAADMIHDELQQRVAKLEAAGYVAKKAPSAKDAPKPEAKASQANVRQQRTPTPQRAAATEPERPLTRKELIGRLAPTLRWRE